jgi:PLP dependent protein
MSIQNNIAIVERNIQTAMRERANVSGQALVPVKLIAVTKNHTPAEMQQAIDCGLTTIGENRVQEAVAKYDIFGRKLEYHLLGHLQKNKVKQAVPLFDLIHSLDSEKLARHISRVAGELAKIQPVLLEVNVAGEATKQGVSLADVLDFVRMVSSLPNLVVAGLMTVAPHFDDPEETRPLFHTLYDKFMELKQACIPNCTMEWLSMGMTNDYSVAIEEGANMVRVGTAIFGARNYDIELTRR